MLTTLAEEIAAMLAKNDRDEKQMSAAVIARTNAASLVAKVEVRTRSRMLAYEQVARGVGRSATWVRALISNGLSRVDGDVGRKIDVLLIREIHAEFARLTAEYHLALQRGEHPRGDEISEIETQMARLKGLLERGPK